MLLIYLLVPSFPNTDQTYSFEFNKYNFFTAGTPASLSCGSMTLGSTDPRRRTPSMTATSSPTHTADIHDFDTRDFVIAPTLTPSPPLTTSLSPGTSVTSSPQHFYPRTPGHPNTTDDEEQEYVTTQQQHPLQSPYRHQNTGQKTTRHLTTASPTQTTSTVHIAPPPYSIRNITNTTNTTISTNEMPVTQPSMRHDWQRSASCRNLPNDRSITSRSFYDTLYNQERLLDAPVTRYDDSRRICYSTAGSKMGSVDRGPDSVTPDTRIYSSSYPGTTSSLSTESGGADDPGMMEGGSECILLGTADTGSQEEILLSHDDLSHDSYELLEREQDEDEDAEDEAEMEGVTFRSRVKSYVGTRSCSLDSSGDNLPLDSPDNFRKDELHSPEIFQMDTDECDNVEDYIPKRSDHLVPIDQAVLPSTNIDVSSKDLSSIDFVKDVKLNENIFQPHPQKPKDADSKTRSNLSLDVNQLIDMNKLAEDISPEKLIGGVVKKEESFNLTDMDIKENLKNSEKQAQTLISDYNCESDSVKHIDEIDNRHQMDIRKASDDPGKNKLLDTNKHVVNRSKRWALTHQKSIDLTPAESTDIGGDDENLSKEPLSPEITIPYVLHKLHPMNGTAFGPDGTPIGATPVSRGFHSKSFDTISYKLENFNASLQSEINIAKNKLSDLNDNSPSVSVGSFDEVAVVPSLPIEEEVICEPNKLDEDNDVSKKEVVISPSNETLCTTSPDSVTISATDKRKLLSERSFPSEMSLDRDLKSEILNTQERLVGSPFLAPVKPVLVNQPKEIGSTPFVSRRAKSDASGQQKGSAFVQRRTQSDVTRQRDEGDSLVPELSTEMLEIVKCDESKQIKLSNDAQDDELDPSNIKNEILNRATTPTAFSQRRAKSDISREKVDSGVGFLQRRTKSDVSRREEIVSNIFSRAQKPLQSPTLHKEALRSAFAQSHYQQVVSSQDSVVSGSTSISKSDLPSLDRMSVSLDNESVLPTNVKNEISGVTNSPIPEKYDMSKHQAAFVQRRTKSDVSNQHHHPKEAVVRRTKSDVTPRKPEADQLVPSLDKQFSEEIADSAVPVMSFRESFETSFDAVMTQDSLDESSLHQTKNFSVDKKTNDVSSSQTLSKDIKSSNILASFKKEADVGDSSKSKPAGIKRQGSSFEELLKGDESFFHLPDFLSSDIRRPIDEGWQRAPALVEAARRGIVSGHKRDCSPVLFARARLGWSEGSTVLPSFNSLCSTESPTASRRAKSLDAPVVSLHRLPPADSFSSKDDTVDNNEEAPKLLSKSASVGSNVPTKPPVLPPQHKSLPSSQSISARKPVLPPKPARCTSKQSLPVPKTDDKSQKRAKSPLLSNKFAKSTSSSGIKLGVCSVSKPLPGTVSKVGSGKTSLITSGKGMITSGFKHHQSKLEPSKAIDIPSPKERLLMMKEKEHAKSESFSSSKSLQADKNIPEYRKAKSLEEKIKEVLEKSPEREILIISPPNADGDVVKRTSPRKLLATKSWSQEKKDMKHKLETASKSLEVPKTEYGFLQHEKERVVPDIVSPQKHAKDLRKQLHRECAGLSQEFESGKHEPRLDVSKSLKKEIANLVYADGSEDSAVESLDEDPTPELWIISDEKEEISSVRPIPREDLVLEFKEAYRIVEKSLESPDVCSDYDNLTPPILRAKSTPMTDDINIIPTASFEEYADIDIPRSSEEEAKTDQLSKAESLDETLKADAVLDLEDTSDDRVVPDVPVSTTDDSGGDEKLGPSEDERIEAGISYNNCKKDDESSESPREETNVMERTRSEEEASTSSSLALAPRIEMSAVTNWRPFPLESSGSSSLEDAFFPPDDAAHLADEEETSSTSNNHRDDTFQDDLMDFPTGFGYPCGLSGADVIVAGYGAAPFSLSRTLSRISERSTTSEQERSDLEEDSTKPSSRSPSVDDESLLSSDHQPSLSSDPPSGAGGALQSDEAQGKSEITDIPCDSPKEEAPMTTSTMLPKNQASSAAPTSAHPYVPPLISDDDWPSPPTSSSLFETPVVSHVETFFMEIHPEEACKVTVLDSTDPTGGDESSTDENHTLHDEEDDFMSGPGDECLSSSATTIDGTVKVAVRPKCPSYYCAGSSLSEDTSMGLSLSEWSSSQGTVLPQCHVHYSSAKSDDTSLDELGGLSLCDQQFSKSRTRSPSFYSGAKSDTCLDDTSPTRLSKTPSGLRCQTYYSSKSLTSVDTSVDDISVPILSSEKTMKLTKPKCTPYYSTASCSSLDSSVLGEKGILSQPSVDSNLKVQTFLDDTSLSSQSLSDRSTSLQTTLIEKGTRGASSSLKTPQRSKAYSYYSSAKSPPSDGDSSSSLDAPAAERTVRVPKRKKSQTRRRHRVTVDLEVRDGQIIEVASTSATTPDSIKENHKSESSTLSTSTQKSTVKSFVPKQSSV